MTATEAPHSHEDRPQSLEQLPFREYVSNDGLHRLEYFGDIGAKELVPFQLLVNGNPLGLAVQALCVQFRAMEAKVNGLMRERDEALTQAALLKGEVEKLTQRCDGLRDGYANEVANLKEQLKKAQQKRGREDA